MAEAANTAEQGDRWATKAKQWLYKQGAALLGGQCDTGKQSTNGMQTQPPSSENLELSGKSLSLCYSWANIWRPRP